MNIETKKALGRYCTYILFFVFIFALGLYLGLNNRSGSGSGGDGPGGNNGSAEHGTGTGNADHGTGTGSGSGDQGTGKGSEGNGPGSGAKSVVWKPEESPDGPPVKKAPAKSKGAAAPKKTVIQQKTEKSSPIRVFNADDAAGDVASIFVNQKPTSGGSSGGTGTAAGFFGVKFSGSDRVIFLLDMSGSMQAHTKDGSMTRLDLVKKEMGKSLKAANRDAKRKGSKGIFKIVCFSTDYVFFPSQKKNLSFSSNSHIKQATEFIRQLTPNGGTFMMKVWHGIRDIIRSNEIEIVYFLSDGEPGDCNAPQLLQFLKKNFKRLKIHTISMGTPSDLLKNIASQHKGVYREVY